MMNLSLQELPVRGAYTFTTPAHTDGRGAFSVLFAQETWAYHHLNPLIAQVNYVVNPDAYTLRGLHYQLAPFAEAKTIRCVSGALYDVILDLRHGTHTYGRWCSVTLRTPNEVVYVPEGCAHGYLTLEPNTTVLYTVSKAYTPELAHGIRWNDPSFHIEWPALPRMIAERDATYPDYLS